MPTPQNPEPQTPQSADKVKAFITGMVVAASALVGGLAVVLWNRKALSGLHSASRKKPPAPPDEDEA